MKTSAFEVLGPVMVGPSSSHTAGALRIALVARQLAGSPIRAARFTLYGSFAATAHGHGTDRALVAGILGLAADDMRIRDSFDLARAEGISFSFVQDAETPTDHPNTVGIDLTLVDGSSLSVMGESVGGGRVRIVSLDGVHVEITGELETLFVCHQDLPGALASLTGVLSEASVNIATMRTYRTSPGGTAYSVFEMDSRLTDDLVGIISALDVVRSAAIVRVPGVSPASTAGAVAHDFGTASALLEVCQDEGCSIGMCMRRREEELSGDAPSVAASMARVASVMREAATATIDEPARSLGGLLCGQAKDVATSARTLAAPLMGETLTRACAYAMATLERSASMGVIVAAPTAGSAGVVPGALLACSETAGIPRDSLEDALWCTAAIGALAMGEATVSGAEGGCQAEVGVAAAMAAAGLSQMLGGSPETCLDAASIALANVMGLVCDPVGGLVEYPCQDRNALGVADAMVAAQLALSRVASPLPLDEVLHAMASVGSALPPSLRETALGGLAAAPSAARVCAACGGCSD